jgi:hypothetical protein
MRHCSLVLFLSGFLFFMVVGYGQTREEEFLEAAKEFEEIEEDQSILPDAVGEEIDSAAIRFFFIAARPYRGSLYVFEDGAYKRIEPAYNGFGPIHRVSPRPKLTFYERREGTAADEDPFVYNPLFELPLSGLSDLFAAFLPAFEPKNDGTVYPLNVIDFSPEVFPYDHVTFMNTLNQPLLVRMGEEGAVIPPGKLLRSTYTIHRKGVGYLTVSLAIREPEGDLRLLYNKRIPAYEGERMIAIPIADPWGARGIEVLLHRDTGDNQQQ